MNRYAALFSGEAMRRREFITLVGGAAVAWPIAVRAQQDDRMRRIGVLFGLAANDPEAQAYVASLQQGLQEAGWTVGRNVRIDYRWSGGNAEDARKYAMELVALGPDVLVATGGASIGPLFQATRSIPIVFANVPDPVGSGFVESLSHPGGNTTGFLQFEYSLSGKWPELLKQIAPNVTRAAVLRDLAITAGIGQFAVIQAMAPSQSLEVTAINASDEKEIERGIEASARSPNGGLIVTASASNLGNRKLIVALAARHRLPAVYFQRAFVTEGGLISYGADFLDQYRRAAGYIDRILKGEKAADLPVQAPTKYELVINLKTAKALGLTIPPSVLARADEVIE
jgi:putative tryptophan/tyrosine transport system substrate-binding protein